VKVPVFRRTKPDQPPATTGEPETEGRKGRPTPTRKEAESAARARAKTPLDKKAAGKMSRDQRTSQSARIRQGIKEGDERYLPARDKGPVRKFARDTIDARFNVAEFFLPMAVVILVLSVVQVGALQSIALLLWLVVIVLIVLDSVLTGFRLKKRLAERFPDQNRKGAVAYALMRSLQMRRLRLPKPQVKRGERP
jgi:Protein of unknown function (DUF3043)